MGGFTITSSPSPRLQRMRVMMAPVVMMLMRIRMLALPVMMRWLLELLTLCHSWQKGRVLLGMSDEAWLCQLNGTCPDGSKFSLGYLYKWGDFFYKGGHRCGACHNASDAKVRMRKCIIKWNKIAKNDNQYLICVSILSVPPVGSVGGFIYVALDSSRCDWDCDVNVFYIGALICFQRSIQLVL